MTNIQQKIINSQVILFNPEHFCEPTPDIFTCQHWHKKDAITGHATGRGTTYFFQHNTNEYVLRHYRRGGLIAKILNDQYLYLGLDQSRAWQEFRLLQHMQTLGLACPEPSAAMLTKHGIYYQADIIFSKIPDAQDLHHMLLTQELVTQSWQKIGQTVAEFHNQQIYHHDLNIHNIMIDTAHRIWLIDFDKCAIKNGDEWKLVNIKRLKRSFEKEQRLHNIHWQKADWQALFTAYNNAAEYKIPNL